MSVELLMTSRGQNVLYCAPITSVLLLSDRVAAADDTNRTASHGLFGKDDYNLNWNPVEYLEQYYKIKPKPAHEPSFKKWSMGHIQRFLQDTEKGEGRLLDVGTDGNFCYLISAALKFDNIYVSDFNLKSIQELKNFVHGNTSFDWSSVMKYAASLHNHSDWQKLYKQVRLSVKGVLQCDISQEDLLYPNMIAPVDVLVATFAIESATLDHIEYAEALKRMTKYYLKSGGTIILIAAIEQNTWKVGNKTYHSSHVSRDQIKEALYSAGFNDITMLEFGFKSETDVVSGSKSKKDGQLTNQTNKFGKCDCDAAGMVLVKAVKQK